jgi:uncharacterized membrane protein
MSLRTRYWLFQTIGWGTYSALGLVAALGFNPTPQAGQPAGWRSALVIGYVLFFCYSIALTEAFRRVMIANRWLERSSWGLWLRLAAGVLVIAVIQIFLVVSISAAMLPRGDAW